MRLEKCWMAVCLAALLTSPLTAVAEDGGSHGGSGGGTVSDARHGDDHDQNGNGADPDGHQGGPNQNAPGASGAPNEGTNDPNLQPQRIRVTLAGTDAGIAIGASARADVRAQGKEQRLSVEMEASVPDGTMFTLIANTIPIGTIAIQLGEGEFEFESENGETLTGGLLPAAITSIAVTDSSNAVVLQAQFGALSTNNSGLPPVLAMRKRLQLTPSAAGKAINAEGHADLRSGGTDTRLKVEVEGSVPDGTVWTVLANGNLKLGTITLRLMEAELHLDGAALAQAGITDASSIASIQVNDAGGNQVLAGSF